MIDSIAAFDCVHWPILLKTLEIYRIKNNENKWMENYLTVRSQKMIIGGQSSQTIPLMSGVPQGSILGPLLYTIFKNELTDILNQNNWQETCHSLDRKYLFRANILKCGATVCYADDAIATITGPEDTLQTKIHKTITSITDFLTINKLKINNDKTVLIHINKRGQGLGGSGGTLFEKK